MNITTNNVPRDIIEFYELSDKDQEDFKACKECEAFFRYKGEVYYLGDFTLAPNSMFPSWDGYITDSFFSGILIKYTDAFERVIVGRYCT